MSKLPSSALIAYDGAVSREGAMLVPHDTAFPSAMMSLGVLMGLPHDTRIIHQHNMDWRADGDYNLHLAVSGEGFKFLFDAAEYFRFALPEGAEPVRDCFDVIGAPARVYSNADVPGLDGGWADEAALRSLVLRHLADGLPALLLGRTSVDRVLLAVGYEDAGDTLVAWTFEPGADMTNKSFAVADCQYIRNWHLGTDAVALADGAPVPVPDEARREILLRTMRRGERFLREPVCAPYGRMVNYYDEWIARLRDQSSSAAPDGGAPHIYPEIWDLAERRSYVSGFLVRAGMELGCLEALGPAIGAGHEIHQRMWDIHAMVEGERAIEPPALRSRVVEVVQGVRKLDLMMADSIRDAL